MKKSFQVNNKKLLGLLLFFIGLVILLTPFTPGSILIIIGLEMMYGHKIEWWEELKGKMWRILKR